MIESSRKSLNKHLRRFVVAFEAVEADFDTFNSCHVSTHFIFEPSLHFNHLRKLDLLRALACALLLYSLTGKSCQPLPGVRMKCTNAKDLFRSEFYF